MEIPIIRVGEKLDFGGGNRPRDGYRSVDIIPGENVDYVCDFTKELPMANDSVGAILFHHAFEHISWRELPSVLKECYRVLEPQGTINIVVPQDAFWYAVNGIKFLLRMEYSPEKLYGGQENIGNFHKTGFTKTKLKRLLKEAEFMDVKVRTSRKNS